MASRHDIGTHDDIRRIVDDDRQSWGVGQGEAPAGDIDDDRVELDGIDLHVPLGSESLGQAPPPRPMAGARRRGLRSRRRRLRA